MSKSSDLPLYLSVYKLLLYLYGLVNNFPKSYKYSLGKDILNLAWETLDLIIVTNNLPNNEKSLSIIRTSVAFDRLKIRLRLGLEIRLINCKKFAYLVEINEEIGKMLTGWLNWSERA